MYLFRVHGRGRGFGIEWSQVGQVAAQMPERVCHTVFVEAFLPIDGKSLIEVSGLDWNTEIRLRSTRAYGLLRHTTNLRSSRI